MTTTTIASKIQTTFNNLIDNIQTHPYYQKVMSKPPLERWLTITGWFIVSQIVVFGSLYLIFGKIVVIGFLPSIRSWRTTRTFFQNHI